MYILILTFTNIIYYFVCLCRFIFGGKNMMTKFSQNQWKEFRKTKLLWFINMILHVFGWVIVLEDNGHGGIEAVPRRSTFRGFPEKTNTMGYLLLQKYLKENIDEIYKETEDQPEVCALVPDTPRDVRHRIMNKQRAMNKRVMKLLGTRDERLTAEQIEHPKKVYNKGTAKKRRAK